ncbi:unnamed protein product [Dibothriocephalus latus]|uniref:Uncharacterized protein n=1 Tax=Dibothriocephalus latus TaxID=60516 RepID=A0A3P6R3R1_DIBLA|nr:unnamed protein product [Dibothriocephalus latus]
MGVVEGIEFVIVPYSRRLIVSFLRASLALWRAALTPCLASLAWQRARLDTNWAVLLGHVDGCKIPGRTCHYPRAREGKFVAFFQSVGSDLRQWVAVAHCLFVLRYSRAKSSPGLPCIVARTVATWHLINDARLLIYLQQRVPECWWLFSVCSPWARMEAAANSLSGGPEDAVVIALVTQVHCNVFYPRKVCPNTAAFMRHRVVVMEPEHVGCVSRLSIHSGVEFPIGSANDEDVQERQLSNIPFNIFELVIGEDAVKQVFEVC